MRNTKIIIAFVLSCLLVFLCGCNTALSDHKDNKKAEAEKTAIVDMFAQYGEYDNGYFTFSNTKTEQSNIITCSFSYSTADDMLVCGYAITADETTYSLYDSGTIVFSWGNLANGAFYGQHILYEDFLGDEISSLEFQYQVSNFSANSSANEYTTNILTNTFPQLSSNEIAIYAKTCFDYIEESLNYAQSIISSYTDGITLK